MAGEGEPKTINAPVAIVKVLELVGIRDTKYGFDNMWVYAHISAPARTEKGPIQYALIAGAPQHGIAYLGTINPETREFSEFNRANGARTFYDRASNNVICKMYAPAYQMNQLQTLDEILAIEGLHLRRELIPH